MKSYSSFLKNKPTKRPYPYYKENNLENLKSNLFKKIKNYNRIFRRFNFKYQIKI